MLKKRDEFDSSDTWNCFRVWYDELKYELEYEFLYYVGCHVGDTETKHASAFIFNIWLKYNAQSE